jgi:hypothetical protein
VLRPMLAFKADPSQSLFEADIKTCHPMLLLTLVTDPKERLQYEQVLSGDIYQDIVRHSGGTVSREEVKDPIIWVFINGKQTENVAAAYFEANFPVLTRAILAHPNPAVYCQQLESDIICRKVGVAAMRRRIWFVPQHDGYLSKSQEDAATIAKLVKDEVEKVSGFRPGIKVNGLNVAVNEYQL